MDALSTTVVVDLMTLVPVLLLVVDPTTTPLLVDRTTPLLTPVVVVVVVPTREVEPQQEVDLSQAELPRVVWVSGARAAGSH